MSEIQKSAAEKARETRERNTAARTALYQEQRAAVKTARKGLLRVMDSEESAPAEILDAARLLAELVKY